MPSQVINNDNNEERNFINSELSMQTMMGEASRIVEEPASMKDMYTSQYAIAGINDSFTSSILNMKQADERIMTNRNVLYESRKNFVDKPSILIEKDGKSQSQSVPKHDRMRVKSQLQMMKISKYSSLKDAAQ